MTGKLFYLEDLKFTKFFDVKSPVGIKQRGEDLSNYSIGVDLYVPYITNNFLDELKKLNSKKYPDCDFWKNEFDNSDGTKFEIIKLQTSDEEDILMIEHQAYSSKGKFRVLKPVAIPTGIGILIPEYVWVEARTKSSNFNIQLTEVHGTIDMNYTYGMGVQIIPFENEIPTLESEQKFTQIVAHPAVPILQMTEMSQKEWDNNDEVKYKRGLRTGGFGSGGKFDENKTEA